MVSEFVPESESIHASINVRPVGDTKSGKLYVTENRAVFKTEKKLLDLELSEVVEVEVNKAEISVAMAGMGWGLVGIGGMLFVINNTPGQTFVGGFGVALLLIGMSILGIGYVLKETKIVLRTAVEEHKFRCSDQDGIRDIVTALRQ
jgi:hypothetical protein